MVIAEDPEGALVAIGPVFTDKTVLLIEETAAARGWKIAPAPALVLSKFDFIDAGAGGSRG